ncbi:MAG: hypothetical protein WD533_07735, partial [Dehalococcoidia bacterium]
FHKSDDELIKRLQIVMQDIASAGGDLARADANLREGRNLAVDIATRIADDPKAWGTDAIAVDYREDAVADAFASLLSGISGFRGSQPVTQWFAEELQSRSEELQAAREADAAGKASDGGGRWDDGVEPLVFTQPVWREFETAFPREAFLLRLRYLLRRTPEEAAAIVGVATARTVNMRVNRARDKFKDHCTQAGLDIRSTERLLTELGEVQKQ